MKKIYILIAFCLSVLTLFANSPVAVCAKTKGKVNITNSKKTNKLKQGTMVYNNNVIQSFQDAYAAVQFVDGNALLKIYPETKIKVVASKKNNKLVKSPFVNIGKIYANVKKNTGNFKIKTPTAVASVKGTSYLLKVDENGNTWLWVTSGSVKILDNQGNVIIVPKGKKAVPNGKQGYIVSNYSTKEILKQSNNDESIINKTNNLQINLHDDNGNKKSINIELE